MLFIKKNDDIKDCCLDTLTLYKKSKFISITKLLGVLGIKIVGCKNNYLSEIKKLLKFQKLTT